MEHRVGDVVSAELPGGNIEELHILTITRRRMFTADLSSAVSARASGALCVAHPATGLQTPDDPECSAADLPDREVQEIRDVSSRAEAASMRSGFSDREDSVDVAE